MSKKMAIKLLKDAKAKIPYIDYDKGYCAWCEVNACIREAIKELEEE